MDSIATAVGVRRRCGKALLSLAVIAWLFGIVNTLALSIHERTRELGMLASRGDVAVVFAALAGMVAANGPARRASKLDVLRALAYE